MRAVVFRGPKDIKVEEVAKPQLSTKKVLVEFRAGSICGKPVKVVIVA